MVGVRRCFAFDTRMDLISSNKPTIRWYACSFSVSVSRVMLMKWFLVVLMLLMEWVSLPGGLPGSLPGGGATMVVQNLREMVGRAAGN